MRFLKRIKPFRIILILGIVILLIHVVSAVTLDRQIEYKRVSFHAEKVPAEMNGYKIAFIADTHAIAARELEKAVTEINRWQPDLLILGGDFPSSDGAPERTMEILSMVETTDGIYGVEGNHDYYTELFAAMEQYGIKPFSNSGVHVREHFYAAGLEDLWNRDPDVKKAIKEALTDDFVLLIAHNPDVTMVQDTASVDLILSGHTHGGQITFFGLWAPALTGRKNITEYGRRFMSGWAESRDGTPVYVSNGTGTFKNIPRVFARPQVILLTLYHAIAN